MFKFFVLNWNNLIVVIWSIGKGEFWKKEVNLSPGNLIRNYSGWIFFAIILSWVKLPKELS